MKILFAFLSILLFITGCNNKNESAESKNENSSYSIEIADSDKIKEIISEREGRLLFINVWATWCIPCIEEFPDIVKLADEYRNNGVDFLSLSADFPEEIDSKIIPFLKEQNVNFPVYVIEEQESEKIIRMLDKKWSGALPATFIYNEKGEQKVFLLGLQNYKTFKINVDSILSL